MSKIYSLQFHTRPKRKVHTYWFTDEVNARAFWDSVKSNPNVLDYQVFLTEADVADRYIDGMDDPPIEMLDIKR